MDISDCKTDSEDSIGKLLEFLQLVGKLKKVKRTGWVLRHVEDPECIAGHMYRMAIMTFLLGGAQDVDKIRCLKLAVVHDLAECIVGDITPRCGVAVDEKHRREDAAMKHLADLVGHCGEELYQLYKEYEEQKTAEARTVKELDRFDMILQAFEYEKCENRPHALQEFFESTKGLMVMVHNDVLKSCSPTAGRPLLLPSMDSIFRSASRRITQPEVEPDLDIIMEHGHQARKQF